MRPGIGWNASCTAKLSCFETLNYHPKLWLISYSFLAYRFILFWNHSFILVSPCQMCPNCCLVFKDLLCTFFGVHAYVIPSDFCYLLSLGQWLCWWTMAPRGYLQPSSHYDMMIFWIPVPATRVWPLISSILEITFSKCMYI